jgi:hypothetical protein
MKARAFAPGFTDPGGVRKKGAIRYVSHPVVPPCLLCSGQMGLGFLRHAQEVLGVALADGFSVLQLIEPLGGVLAERLQHPEALARIPEQALIDR